MNYSYRVNPVYKAWKEFDYAIYDMIKRYNYSDVQDALQQSNIEFEKLYKKYNPAEIVAQAKEEIAKRKEQERSERLEAKKRIISGEIKDESDIYKGMSQKEKNRMKLANARKRDAEKYGDYND